MGLSYGLNTFESVSKRIRAFQASDGFRQAARLSGQCHEELRGDFRNVSKRFRMFQRGFKVLTLRFVL